MNEDKKRFEAVSCDLCGSKKYSIIYGAEYEKEKDVNLADKFRASGDELLIDQLVKCSRCGLIYINPRIKSDLIIGGYSEGSDETFVSQADAREITFQRSIKEIEKHVPNKGKILDVGTAAGSFLAAAKKRGWNVYGCEPNKWLVDWGNKRYGLSLKPGTVLEQKYEAGFFDVVTLWDVIEHTPNPSEVLKECNRVLKTKGLLVVNYPDIGSLISRLMGRKWLFLNSVHLYYFTRKTMTAMLKKQNFEVITVKPYFQRLEMGYLLFRGAAYSKIISKAGMGIAKNLNMEKRLLPYWLGQTFVVARKKSGAEK
jgi:2-polyprenyl-3-methyl-5-hydroxy-6-metoxy-1,4-benzoquinol methylase